MTDRKRQEAISREQHHEGGQGRARKDTAQNGPEPGKDDRFDQDRVNRDRSAYESENQGQGPQHVGDQSRTR